MNRWSLLPLVVLLACAPAVQTSSAPRSVPSGAGEAADERVEPRVVPPPDFLAAVAAGTRTLTGEPGPRYWRNRADYRMEVRVLTDSLRLEGTAGIRYHNRSPDQLPLLVVDLLQNFHAPGARRLEEAEVTGGVRLDRVAVGGQALGARTSGPNRYLVDGTKLIIYPQRPVAAGGTVDLEIDWSFAIPQAGIGGRMGHSRGDLIFLGYFYPQMAVYDDVIGWDPDQFLGGAEFYADFGSYDVTVEVPAGWLVQGTGRLTNAEEVLAPVIMERLRAAEASDTIVHVVTARDLDGATRASTGVQRWTFHADSVRDVAYSLTRRSVWDATRTAVGDRDGDGVVDHTRIDAIYRETAPLWTGVAADAQHAVRFLSGFTGIPYPWPQMSVVEGGDIIGGGMEFPMITLIGEYTTAGADALYNTTAHEISHMWVPMIVSSNERRYAWMDEGTTNFNENQSRKDLTPGATPELADRTVYLRIASAGEEGEIMRRSDYHYPGPAYAIATYYKPSTMLATLRGVLGEEVLLRAYRDYLDRWQYRHPYPWDMWNSFERVSGRDLDWFWRSWYYETGVLDQAIEAVRPVAAGTEIVVRSTGTNPMPTRLAIRLDDGTTVEREIPVERWFGGVERNVVTVSGGVIGVEIDPGNLFPDIDRSNNVWER